MDIFKLFSEHILRNQTPEAEIIKLKFFTTDIKANLASRGQLAHKSQQDYHRAIYECYPTTIEIIKGYHSHDRAILPVYKKPPEKNDRVSVWRLEEKQTDVNIALHMYRDSVKKEANQIVLVSNDTDLEPALKMIRLDLGEQIRIGVVIPVPKPTEKAHRPPNKKLSDYADWTRRYILDNELKNCLLPDLIPTKKKPIRKPEYW